MEYMNYIIECACRSENPVKEDDDWKEHLSIISDKAYSTESYDDNNNITETYRLRK